jgi:hypothetical protein
LSSAKTREEKEYIYIPLGGIKKKERIGKRKEKKRKTIHI